MFKLVLISLTITYANAGGALVGLSSGYGNEYGSGLVLSGGYGGSGLSSGGGLGYSGGHSAPIGPVSAAIQSHRTYEVIPVAVHQEAAIPQIIEVQPSEQPVQVIFRSLSSPVYVKQIHTPGAPGQVESTQSEDEPHRVTHQVLRPVIQEVREVIQPYRRVVQEIRPVQEEVHTIVAKGEGRNYGGLEGYSGKGSSLGYAQSNIDTSALLSKGYGGYRKAAAAKKAAA